MSKKRILYPGNNTSDEAVAKCLECYPESCDVCHLHDEPRGECFECPRPDGPTLRDGEVAAKAVGAVLKAINDLAEAQRRELNGNPLTDGRYQGMKKCANLIVAALEGIAAQGNKQPQASVNEDSFEVRVEHWVRTRIGDAHMQSRERAMRLLEESIELAQAEGISGADMYKQVKHVFGRESGYPRQEAGGVAVCLLGWCAANGTTFHEIAKAEIERIEAKPVSEIRGSVARKQDDDLVCVVAP